MTVSADLFAESHRTFARIVTAHPLPWKYVPHESTIYMLDATGKLVQLFDVLDFCTAQSNIIAFNVQTTGSAAAPAAT